MGPCCSRFPSFAHSLRSRPDTIVFDDRIVSPDKNDVDVSTKVNKPNSYTADPTRKGDKSIASKPLPSPPIADDDDTSGHFSQSTAVPYKVLQALYTYDARTDDELSFIEGDRMYLIDSQEENWWLVCHVDNTDVKGYVPYNYVVIADTLDTYEWYHGDISRADSRRLLLVDGLERGTFLIRVSQENVLGHTHTICMRDYDAKRDSFVVRNYKVFTTETGGYTVAVQSTKQIFADLSQLVQHFSECADGLSHKLTVPCPKPLPNIDDLSPATKDNWEIDRSTLKFSALLGTGNFGKVYQGKWNDTTDVAIKTLKEGTMKPEKFLEEAHIMKNLHHVNLVTLYAVCTTEEPIYIVTEFMSHGDLLNYLRKGEGKGIKLLAMIDIVTQIASGMAHLESKCYIHRDLAARNVLVGPNMQAKIADFGLTRQIEDETYHPQSGTKFPVKWTAPEVINFAEYTIKSDVWAFGVVLFEVVTRGQIPYRDMSNKEVISQVCMGYRMPKPSYCPQSMYEKMLECWNQEKYDRPTFEHLHGFFDSYFIATEPNYSEQEDKI